MDGNGFIIIEQMYCTVIFAHMKEQTLSVLKTGITSVNIHK